jgi:predicted signal transduction protein with EAL and GGDEF domain
MRLSNFSLRYILGLNIGMMGLLALALALLSGSIHRDLVFENQQIMMEEIIQVATIERLRKLRDTSSDLGLALQSTPAFKDAIKAKDKTTLTKLLNNQFHQYFVTTGAIKLEQLALFDKNFSLLTEATDGSIFFSNPHENICPHFLNRVRLRSGSQRMTITQGICQYDGRPIYVVVAPIGGLRLKGYIAVVTDPAHNLATLDSYLGMPIQLQLNNNEVIFQAQDWPDEESDSFISSYELTTSEDIPILSIWAAHNISDLSTLLQEARLKVFLIAGLVTLLIVILSIVVLHKTLLSHLSMLAKKLSDLHIDQTHMGDQIKPAGPKEIHNIIAGFNNMSRKLSEFYLSLGRMAYTDALTKLPNRNQFQESLEDFILLHKQIEKSFALFLIDLDRFKGVNDTLGHNIGDGLLKEVSLRLKKVLRDEDVVSRVDTKSISQLNEDIVARLGGDEFSAILTSIHTADNAIIVARKLVRAMEQPFIVNEHQLIIGLSIGIVLFPDHGEDINTLVSHADIAMYDAKNRNCGFSIYDPSQHTNTLHSLKLEQDLFAGIRNNELILHYQPKISVASGALMGMEALIRWQHPTLGIIAPNDFIPMAEQTGLIQPLTEWVLNKALEDYSKNLCANKPLHIAVNISALNLRDERFSSVIANVLETWSVPPEMLTLELTESAIMADPKFSTPILAKLDEMGVTLSIDDFGTGYSSLAYVKNLPVDELKIDRSFIHNITSDSDNEAIVRAVLVLAHNMNLSVVAEGVEDVETLNLLSELGCDTVQGYYFAKPMPFDEFIAWLEHYEDNYSNKSSTSHQ